MLPSQYQQYIHTSRYARFDDSKGRRETWPETVARYFDFMEGHLNDNHGYSISDALRAELETAVLNLDVMPSMRLMMTAGEPVRRNNISAFNCAYTTVDDLKAFSEAMLILLNGTGVGFSVERQYVSKLPEVPDELEKSDTVIVVADSKEGWVRAFAQLLSMLYSGSIPKWDTSKVRPAGARLKTFGGRASGPGPLEYLFRFVVEKISNAAGRKLTSVECHDIMCKVGEVVVVGGVRRSAMISLSNLSDDRMRNAKSGQWWETEPQRALANNSWCATERPDVGVFMAEWNSLYESKSGERGIFNREASKRQAAKYGRRDTNHDFGTNP